MDPTQALGAPAVSAPPDVATPWLDELLDKAEHLKAPDHFPAAQGAFEAIRRILSAVRNLKEPQVLKDLWEILVHTGIIVQNNENKTPEVRGLVLEFERLLDQIQDEVDKLLSKQAGFEQRPQPLDWTTSSLQKYYTPLVDLQKKLTTGPNTIQMNIYGGTGGAGGAGKFGGPGGIGQGSAFNIEAPYATFNMSERQIQSTTVEKTQAQVFCGCPPPSDFFQGRADVLEELTAYFQPGASQKRKVALLHGVGGVGKTQIALKFISDHSEWFSEQFKVDASSVETLNTGYKAIAEFKKIGSTMEDARIWLSSPTKSWILLLDNADDIHLDLRKYLPYGAEGNILITSRNPDLAVHTGPKGMAVKIVDLAENEAVQLLQHRGRIQTGETNQNAARQIVQELHYFPLAIVQAAGYISRTPSLQADPFQYLTLYKKEKTELWRFQSSQSVDDYKETVYTTWKISFDQLEKYAKQFLELCAFMNHQGVKENIFQWASAYQHVSEVLGPTREQLEKANQFLSGFAVDSKWDTVKFHQMIADICAYSLGQWHRDSFDMHPLVHEWVRSIQTSEISCQTAYILLGMAASYQSGVSEQILIALHVINAMNFCNARDTGFEDCLASVMMAAGSYSKARELYSGVLQKLSAALGAEDPRTWQIIGKLAICDRKLGKYKEAEEYQQKILDRQTVVLGEDHPDTLWTMHDLATSFSYLGKRAEAEELEQKVLQRRITILGADHPDTLWTMHNLAAFSSNLGEHAEAEELQREVLQKRITVLGADHPDTLWTMQSLAVSLSNLGKHAEAEELEQKVLQKRITVLGADHPDTLETMHNLASSYTNLRKYAEAEELQQRVLQKWITLLGADHPDTLLTMHNLATCMTNLGRHAEAEELEQKVLQKRITVLGANHPDTLWTMHNLAVSFSNLGKHAEAEELQQEVLQKRTTVLGADHPDTLATMHNLSVSMSNLGKYADAQRLLKTVLEKQIVVLGQEHPDTLWTKQAIARLEHKMQEPEAVSAKAPRRRWKNFKMKFREAIFKL